MSFFCEGGGTIGSDQNLVSRIAQRQLSVAVVSPGENQADRRRPDGSAYRFSNRYQLLVKGGEGCGLGFPHSSRSIE
jgi:hypothetical protein